MQNISKIIHIIYDVKYNTHHAEGLINSKVRAKKRLLILDSPEPR
jgi:hypothetical protein